MWPIAQTRHVSVLHIARLLAECPKSRALFTTKGN